MELNGSGGIVKTYVYANSEVIAQHEGDTSDDRYFYLHDRLGSVRLVIDDEGAVQNYYTYEPFGQTIESGGTLENPFRFTGQYFDSEIEEYYLRTRQYDPHLARFTSRDPVAGNHKKPVTHHKYLYCGNDPISNIDPLGLLYKPSSLNSDVDATREVTEAAVEFVRERGFPGGSIEAFSWRGYEFDYKGTKYTFQLTDNYILQGSEYTNWLTAYTTTYLYGTIGNWGTRIGGHYHALTDPGMGHFDDPASRYFISGGVLMGDERRYHEMGRSARMSNWDFVRAKFDLYHGIERMADADLTDPSFDRELELFTTFWNSGSPR